MSWLFNVFPKSHGAVTVLQTLLNALGFTVTVGEWKDVFVPGVSDKWECGLG